MFNSWEFQTRSVPTGYSPGPITKAVVPPHLPNRGLRL